MLAVPEDKVLHSGIVSVGACQVLGRFGRTVTSNAGALECSNAAGKIVFFPGPSRPTERLQHQPDTENPNAHPASTKAD